LNSRPIEDEVLKCVRRYKTLHLSALGAAIPLLTTLTTSLPSILPFATDQIRFEYKTGTVQVQDELIPEAEEDDVVYETRGKSNLTVTVHVDGGDGDVVLVPKRSKKVSTKRDISRSSKTKANTGSAVTKPALPQEVVFQEPDQDDMDSS
jgi:ribonuclease P/MRP protein subunit RPP20